MKKITIISFFIFIFHYTYSQNIYYDAVKLGKYSTKDTKGFVTIGSTDKAKNDTILTILNKYFPGILSKNQPGSLLRMNPYLTTFTYTGSAQSNNLQPQNLNLGSAVSALGSINVTNLANGVSSFIVKRAKEELFIEVIEKLRDSTKFPELPILFPNTIKIMNSFDSWQYSNVLNTLKQSFDKDLQQLLTNIPQLNTKLFDKGKVFNSYSEAAKKRVEIIKKFFNTPEACIYLSALQIGNGFISGQKLPDVINIISGTGYLGDIPNLNVKNAIQLVNIFSLSLESNQKGENYISTAELTTLLKDPIGGKLYFGLLYQEINNQHFTFNSPFSIVDNIKKDSVGIVNYLNSLVTSGDDLKIAIQNLMDAKKRGEKDQSTYWATIFESTKQFLQTSTNISSIDSALILPSEIKKFTAFSVDVLTIANDITIRNYSAAVVDFSGLIPDDDSHQDFKKFFVKYGSFIANIVQAQNANDVENAIEAVALPVGSYTIKQNSAFNISLNGYIGYGYDVSYAQGIYAPIGISFSSNNFLFLPCTFKSRWVNTVYISVFDVGSIASYQLNNTTVNGTTSTNSNTSSTTPINTSANNQQIKLGSIFAPGIEGFIEIPKTPFTLGGGYRRTPTLFYSSSTTYSTVGARWEWNLTVLVDIPIFTLFNKTTN